FAGLDCLGFDDEPQSALMGNQKSRADFISGSFWHQISPGRGASSSSAFGRANLISMPNLVEPSPDDLDALLALSNAYEKEIGRVSETAFAKLVALSFRTRMTDKRDAFLIALSQRA